MECEDVVEVEAEHEAQELEIDLEDSEDEFIIDEDESESESKSDYGIVDSCYESDNDSISHAEVTSRSITKSNFG